MAQGALRPVVIFGNNISEKLSKMSAYFALKSSLDKENVDLRFQIDKDKADRANYDSVVAENLELKEILGRKVEQADMTLAAILAKPNQSSYDTLLIDQGEENGIKLGNRVFASGNIPIGYIAEIYPKTAKVVLFSNSGETTQVVIMKKPEIAADGSLLSGTSTSANVFLEIVGRGGGNFEMILPRDFKLSKGDQAVLPGIKPYLVGVVETTISDARDSFQKALLVAPVNIQGLKFVEVETQK